MKNVISRLKWLSAASRYSPKMGPRERSVYQDKFSISRVQMQRDIKSIDQGPAESAWPLSGYLEDILAPTGAFVRIDPPRRSQPDDHTIRNVVSALQSGTVLTCRYVSVSSGTSFKQIVPHLVVDVCGRLHLRGYDIMRRRHADFVLSRMSGANDTERKPAVRIPDDEDMERRVLVQITPGQDLPAESVAAIEADYGMASGVRTENIPAAFAIYLPEIFGFTPEDEIGAEKKKPIDISVSHVLS